MDSSGFIKQALQGKQRAKPSAPRVFPIFPSQKNTARRPLRRYVLPTVLGNICPHKIKKKIKIKIKIKNKIKTKIKIKSKPCFRRLPRPVFRPYGVCGRNKRL